jgi:hypothetical protein
LLYLIESKNAKTGSKVKKLIVFDLDGTLGESLTGGEFIRNSNVILWYGNATCKQNLSPQLSDGLASSRRGRAAAKTVWELRTQLQPSFGSAFGMASSPRSTIQSWIDCNSATFNT